MVCQKKCYPNQKSQTVKRLCCSDSFKMWKVVSDPPKIVYF